MGSGKESENASWSAVNGSRFDGDVIAAMERAHIEQLALCDTLEEIADSLSGKIDKQKSIHAARSLWPLVRSVHSFEEKMLFPVLEETLPGVEGLKETLARLKFEHTEDECYAEELTDTLFRLGAGDKAVNHETTGYMLRGFFASLRRHIAFEKDHLVMLARASGAFPLSTHGTN